MTQKSWLLIALFLTSAVFVACGSETETVAVAPAAPTATQQAPTNTVVPTPTPTITPVQRLMTGLVVDAVARNATELELLVVRAFGGRVWEFETEGPIGIDAGHLLMHRDTEEGVEVVFLYRGDRLIALEVNDLAR